MCQYLSMLKNTELFENLSYEELEAIFSDGYYMIKEYTKGAVVYFQNERCESLDVLLHGVVLVQKIDASGNILTVSDFTAGETIGGNLLFSNQNFYPMTIFAKTDCTILHIKKERVLSLCQNNIIFLESFLKTISDRTVTLTSRIKSLTMKTIRQCVVEFLLYEYHLQKSPVIKLNRSKKELAERIGVQRSSLSRELSKMRKDGLITFDSRSVTIRDIDTLTKLHVDT